MTNFSRIAQGVQYFAVVVHRRCESRRLVVVHCVATWPSWYSGPACRFLHRGTHSRTGSSYNGKGQRDDLARVLHIPSG